MASSNRTAQINHILKVVKKHFKPVKPTAERTVLEQVLFACCLENSPHEDAEVVFAALKDLYYDWNEVRVSTIRELAETMKPLVDPEASAIRLKRSLQSVFESIYAFELEPLTKENLGKAAERLAKYPGTTPFVVAYVTQTALGGHAIPVNQGLLAAFHVLDVISDEEYQQGAVPGLERAVPKSKGPEAASVFHQFGVLMGRNPYHTSVRKLLLEIDPACKERLPKRPTKAEQREEAKTKTASARTAAAKKGAKKTADRGTESSAAGGAKKATKKSVKSKTSDRRKASTTASSDKKSKASGSKKTAKKTKTASRQLAKSKPR